MANGGRDPNWRRGDDRDWDEDDRGDRDSGAGRYGRGAPGWREDAAGFRGEAFEGRGAMMPDPRNPGPYGAGAGRSDRNPRRPAHDEGRPGYRGPREERGFMDRASDEVSSWFGDDDAERRRQADHRGKGPRGYVRSDARIEEEVNDRLSDDPQVDATDMSVAVADGEVTLSGEVDSRQAKRRAEDCADEVSGVKHVQNNLRVRATPA